jgi:hypothetical protein
VPTDWPPYWNPKHETLPNTRRINSAHEYLDRGILSFLGACGTCLPRIAALPPSADPCSAAAGASTTSVLPRCRQPTPSASPTAGTTRSRALAAGTNTPW